MSPQNPARRRQRLAPPHSGLLHQPPRHPSLSMGMAHGDRVRTPHEGRVMTPEARAKRRARRGKGPAAAPAAPTTPAAPVVDDSSLTTYGYLLTSAQIKALYATTPAKRSAWLAGHMPGLIAAEAAKKQRSANASSPTQGIPIDQLTGGAPPSLSASNNPGLGSSGVDAQGFAPLQADTAGAAGLTDFFSGTTGTIAMVILGGLVLWFVLKKKGR